MKIKISQASQYAPIIVVFPSEEEKLAFKKHIKKIANKKFLSENTIDFWPLQAYDMHISIGLNLSHKTPAEINFFEKTLYLTEKNSFNRKDIGNQSWLEMSARYKEEIEIELSSFQQALENMASNGPLF